MSWIDRLEADLKVSKDPAGSADELARLRSDNASLRALVVEMTEGLEDCADQFCSDDPTEANFRKCIEALIAKAKEQVK